jgi:DNA-3-methyladenine glycosylase II
MKRALDTVGLWTAEMFLIHQLHRQDILPAGDIGVRRAIAHAWTLNEAPTIDEVRQRAQGWAPGRSYATALFWRSPR